jgi:hypothetical protein
MDTLFWTQCNPNVAINYTTKKYFGRYLYKIVVYAPAGRLIDSKDSLDKALEHRKLMAKNINFGGYWGMHRNRDLDRADVAFLDKLRNLRHDKSLNIKMRVEEPRIQIYANDETQLKNLVDSHFSSTEKNYVESFSGPESVYSENLLNSGAIIRRTNIGYRYKVIMKDGRYSPEVKTQLLNYLVNVGTDQVKLSKTGLEMLSKSTGFIWNLYFYTNDLSVVTFVNLISPGIVSNSHELVIATHK